MNKLFLISQRYKVEKLELPKLTGSNIDEHIRNIARQQTEAYSKLMTHFTISGIPEIPAEFAMEPGWVK